MHPPPTHTHAYPPPHAGAQSLDELKSHPFFEGLEWGGLREGPAPAYAPPDAESLGSASSSFDWELQVWVGGWVWVGGGGWRWVGWRFMGGWVGGCCTRLVGQLGASATILPPPGPSPPPSTPAPPPPPPPGARSRWPTRCPASAPPPTTLRWTPTAAAAQARQRQSATTEHAHKQVCARTRTQASVCMCVCARARRTSAPPTPRKNPPIPPRLALRPPPHAS